MYNYRIKYKKKRILESLNKSNFHTNIADYIVDVDHIDVVIIKSTLWLIEVVQNTKESSDIIEFFIEKFSKKFSKENSKFEFFNYTTNKNRSIVKFYFKPNLFEMVSV